MAEARRATGRCGLALLQVKPVLTDLFVAASGDLLAMLHGHLAKFDLAGTTREKADWSVGSTGHMRLGRLRQVHVSYDMISLDVNLETVPAPRAIDGRLPTARCQSRSESRDRSGAIGWQIRNHHSCTG